MCQKKPGNRCSSHLRQQIHTLTSEMTDMLVREGVSSAEDLSGNSASTYVSMNEKLQQAYLDYSTTNAGQNGLKRQISLAEDEGDTAKAERLQNALERGKELKAKRDEAMKAFRANETKAKREFNKPAAASEREVAMVTEENQAVTEALTRLGGDTRPNRRKAHSEQLDAWQTIRREEMKSMQESRKKISSLADAGQPLDDELASYRRSYAMEQRANENIKFHEEKLLQYPPRGLARHRHEQTRASTPARFNNSDRAPETYPTPTSYYGGGGCGGRGC